MDVSRRPAAHFAAVGRDLVVLDLAEDAYVCVPDAWPAEADASGGLGRLDPTVLESLEAAGWIEGSEPRLEPLASPPRRDLAGRPTARIGARDVADLVAALWSLRRLGDDPTVLDLLRSLPPRRRLVQSDRRPVQDAVSAAAALDRLMPWLPGRWLCLRRSALAMTFLRRRGLDADWVFGVRTWPFEAHCWVEAGGVCLTDDWERARSFTPILRLEAARI